MGEIQKYSLKDRLLKADKDLDKSLSILGMSGMTASGHINSMRTVMYTSHLKQFVNLVNPEPPRVFTSMENTVGKYSDGYKKADAEYEVVDKIVKFGDIVKEPTTYVLFLRDVKTGNNVCVTRRLVEDLTENFGFLYNNEKIDSYNVGDVIEKDEVLYKSTSYDEDMNYCYGVNAYTTYTLDPYTSEDAAVVSESFAKRCVSIYLDDYSININDNDFLLNLYGDKKHYKPFPDIGEESNGILCASRRLESSQILFDFKDKNLKTLMDQDKVYSLDFESMVVDITIYNNNEELEENPFNAHIFKYLKSQNKYYKKIYNRCKQIIESGEPYSQDIDYMLKRSAEMIDIEKDKKWKESDSAFSNMVIKIQVLQKSGLHPGQKITGRCGNKSVISTVRPDDEMPFIPLLDKDGNIVYDEDGEPVVKHRIEVLENLCGIINRTTSSPLQELQITSINEQIIDHMAALDDYKEKEIIFFDALNLYNEKEYAHYKSIYDKLSDDDKNKFIDTVIAEGMFIHDPPLWNETAEFYRIDNILKRFDWLHPYPMFVNKWGRNYQCMRNTWPGQMYIMKLKQSDRRGFSARSTGAINTKELPTRSYKSRSHLERISGTAIRFGEFETLNFSIGIIPEDIAMFHGFYRTSIKGRKDLIRMMLDPDCKDKKIDSSYTSRVSEIFDVILKTLSIEVQFNDSDNDLTPLNNREMYEHEINGRTYICTDYQGYLIQKVIDITKDVLEQNPIMPEQELVQMVIDALKSNDYIIGPSVEEFTDSNTVGDIIHQYFK